MANRGPLRSQINSNMPPPVDLLGVPINPISSDELINTFIRWGMEDGKHRASYVNVHAMNLAAEHPGFLDALRRADVTFCDGFGVKWGARLAGLSVPHRLSPPDWIDAFAAATAAARQPVFALGDEPGIAEEFQARMRERHGGYLSAGSHHGFFDRSGYDSTAVIKKINLSGAVHLLVGLGMPQQEMWIDANIQALDARVFLPVGALYRWTTGAEKRAPRWMTDAGLEWLTRLVRHPRRHFRRYVIGNPIFLARLIRSRIGDRT